MLHDERAPDRSVVDAVHDFLPATGLDPDYLKWLATKSEGILKTRPSYFDASARWAAYAAWRPAH